MLCCMCYTELGIARLLPTAYVVGPKKKFREKKGGKKWPKEKRHKRKKATFHIASLSPLSSPIFFYYPALQGPTPYLLAALAPAAVVAAATHATASPFRSVAASSSSSPSPSALASASHS